MYDNGIRVIGYENILYILIWANERPKIYLYFEVGGRVRIFYVQQRNMLTRRNCTLFYMQMRLVFIRACKRARGV